jgi:hypothetical protein
MTDAFLKRFARCFGELHGKEDVFTFLTRGHLFCESALARILTKAVKRPDALDVDRLDYQAKVNLCNALGLIPESLVPGLVKLGKFRNRFVHQLDYIATVQDQSDFINTLRSTCGEPAEYYLSRRIDFPNGIRRCILILFLLLELQLAETGKQRVQMLFSVALLMGKVSGLEPDDFIEQMKKELSSLTPRRRKAQQITAADG